MPTREELLKRVRHNIDKFGYHVSIVTGHNLPRYAYTIGCNESVGVELIVAGGEIYSQTEVTAIIKACFIELKENSDWKNLVVDLHELGKFSLKRSDSTWSRKLALGVFDVYNDGDITVLQIIPDGDHHTLEIPDMSRPFDWMHEPVWQWMTRDFSYPIPKKSMVIVDRNILFGKPATHIMRWEDAEWEIFTVPGEEVSKDDMLMIPLPIVIGIDSSLHFVIDLDLGKGAWRDPAVGIWNEMVSGIEPEES